MDVLLTHAFYLAEDAHEQAVMRPHPPLGILYLASHLKARGVRVGVFDTTFEQRPRFEELVARERPPVVGIYVNLLTRPSALRMMQWAKACGARVVLGGPEPAAYAVQYLQRGADVIVVGEGEATLEELLPRLDRDGPHRLHDVRGIVFRDETGRLVETAPRPYLRDLDRQPFPDRGAVDIPRYLEAWRARHGCGAISLITARGCPYTCTWCSHGVFGYSHRRRSPGNVVEELERLVATYRPDMVWYADDVFTINPRWLAAYARELAARGLRVPFETITREDRLDEEVVRTLAEMGCVRLWMGSESGSQRILDAMQRGTDAARLREMVRLLQRHGIEVGLFVMLGYEGEELTDLEATVAHLKEAAPDQFLTTVAYPIKGTPYYDQVASRIVARRPWELGSDRDLDIAGRPPRRFYRFATRYLVGEVARHRLRQQAPHRYLARLKATFNAQVGRIGMHLTRARAREDLHEPAR
jgi:anaerobic magnesium-protoporphyrin IX monomethyl ester cyclase